MSNPLVTINLVVLNGAKYIRHCLKAVQEQIYQNLEINVFDNGSTDGTKEIVRQEYQKFVETDLKDAFHHKSDCFSEKPAYGSNKFMEQMKKQNRLFIPRSKAGRPQENRT